jgi:pimeloyl-ACP methyl ester carboxylesterase
MPTVARCDLADVDPTTLPSTYLLPRDDRTLLPGWLARVARERLGVEPVELAGGHNPYAAAPGRVADLVAAVGAGAAV